jgi:hypothetical protein
MKNTFSKVAENILTRKFGGTSSTVGTAEPYVTGYHFISFRNIPTNLPTYVKELFKPGEEPSDDDIPNLLAGACLNVTAPGGRIAKIDFAGLGGIRWSIPGAVEYDNSVTVRFLEFQGLPISNIIRGWVRMIRDYRTGLAFARANGSSNAEYTKRDYSSIMYYFTTTPDLKSLEYFACYDGIFPITDPQNLFTSDIETIGKLDLDIEFNVDYIWTEQWVRTTCDKIRSDLAGKVLPIIQGYSYAS